MTLTHVTIIDQNSTAVATVPVQRVAETITPWYPDAPADVLDAIQRLQQVLNAGGDYTGLAVFLGLTIEPGDNPYAVDSSYSEGVGTVRSDDAKEVEYLPDRYDRLKLGDGTAVTP